MTSPPTLNVPKDTLSSIDSGARVVVQRYKENGSIHADARERRSSEGAVIRNVED